MKVERIKSELGSYWLASIRINDRLYLAEGETRRGAKLELMLMLCADEWQRVGGRNEQ